MKGASGVERAQSLPVERAFVVQFSGDASVPKQLISGRVEHVGTGRSRRFESLEELLAFVASLMGDAGTAAPDGRGTSEDV
jgi:hypothetical protein